MNYNVSPLKRARKSSIELLKIIAMFFVVISHVTQTLGNNMALNSAGEPWYLVNLFNATADVQTFILIVFRHLGQLGNKYFFPARHGSCLIKREQKKKNFGL